MVSSQKSECVEFGSRIGIGANPSRNGGECPGTPFLGAHCSTSPLKGQRNSSMPLAPAAQKSFTKWLAGKRFSRFAFDNRSRRRFPPGDVELKAVHLIS